MLQPSHLLVVLGFPCHWISAVRAKLSADGWFARPPQHFNISSAQDFSLPLYLSILLTSPPAMGMAVTEAGL